MNRFIIFFIAKQEINKNLKTYWLLLVGALIFLLNYAIINFSNTISGSADSFNQNVILLSLAHLQMYILSLFALILSHDGMLYEQELGTLELLLSYPIRSSEIVLGKWLGINAVLSIAFLCGFLGIIPSLYGMGISLGVISLLIVLSLSLGVLFVSLGLFISSFAKNRAVIIAICIVIWVLFVFLFDLGFVLLVIYTNGMVDDTFINWLLLFNPIEIYRIIAILGAFPTDYSSLYGLGSGLLTIPYSVIAMLAWIFVPLIITLNKNFGQKDGVKK